MNKSEIESTSRRKAVKTIVGGVTALAAYNMMPVKWGTPVIEQIFLPAHAATSGEAICSEDAIVGTWHVKGNKTENYVEDTVTLLASGSLTGDSVTTGSWSMSGGTLTLVMNWQDGSDSGQDTFTGTLNSDCNSISGTVETLYNGDIYTDTFSGEKL